MELAIDIDRLWRELDQLATFSDAPAPAVTRVLYSPTDKAGRDYVRSLLEEAGLSIRVDAVGNMFGRWEGSDPRAPAVGTGRAPAKLNMTQSPTGLGSFLIQRGPDQGGDGGFEQTPEDRRQHQSLRVEVDDEGAAKAQHPD